MIRRNTCIVSIALLLTAGQVLALDAPTLVSPASNTKAPTAPTFEWNAVNGATWYYLWVNDMTAGTTVLKKWVKGTTQFDLYAALGNDWLTAGHKYRWWVAAWNDAERRGPWSTGRDFTAGNTKYLWIQAADLVPVSDTSIWRCYGASLAHGGAEGSQEFYTSVSLPDDSVVVELKSVWIDLNSLNNVAVRLLHDKPEQKVVDIPMAEADSSGVSSAITPETTVDTTIQDSRIDNKTGFYHLYVAFPNVGDANGRIFYGARITYIE